MVVTLLVKSLSMFKHLMARFKKKRYWLQMTWSW